MIPFLGRIQFIPLILVCSSLRFTKDNLALHVGPLQLPIDRGYRAQ